MKYTEIIQKGLDTSSSKEEQALFIDTIIAFYLEIQAKMASKDPIEMQEALQKTKEIHALLLAKAREMCQKTGLNPSQLNLLSKHPRFKEQHKAVAEARSKLERLLTP